LLNDRGVLGVTRGGIAKERANGGQSRVASPRAVVPVGLDLVEKRHNDRCVEVLETEHEWCLADLTLDEGE
jgi:hypothetical protein